jgi:hypothetical protein
MLMDDASESVYDEVKKYKSKTLVNRHYSSCTFCELEWGCHSIFISFVHASIMIIL